MQDQQARLRKNGHLIKGFMVLVVVMQIVEFFESHVLNMSDVASVVGVLAMLRGILLSPVMLTTPVSQWREQSTLISQSGVKYFMFAGVLLLVGLIS